MEPHCRGSDQEQTVRMRGPGHRDESGVQAVAHQRASPTGPLTTWTADYLPVARSVAPGAGPRGNAATSTLMS
jgi:hypothetical protein